MSQNIISALKKLPQKKLRVDIVKPGLCDEALQRLKPSLERYIGCTIIDINPGVGLFSAKLHEYLQPRNHVLFEPKPKLYQQFLKPLLEAPGSRYCLKDWPDEHRWEIANYIRAGLVPDAEGLGGQPPTTKSPNNLVLIVANVIDRTSHRTIRVGRPGKEGDHSARKATDWARRARQSAGCPNAAPPRMLMWMTDSDKHSILPRSVAHRNRTTAVLEACCHVEEIAGAVSQRMIRREDALDIRSMEKVMERMRTGGISVSKINQRTPSSANLGLSSKSRDWHQELLDLEAKYDPGNTTHLPKTKPGPTPGPRGIAKKPKEERDMKRMHALRSTLKAQNREIEKVGKLVQKHAEIDRMDFEIATSKDIDEDKRKSMLEELDAKIVELKGLQEKLRKKELNRYMFLDDDRRGFEMDPTLLMWDRRNAEPLIAEEEDFYQPCEAALLDFQIDPKSDMPSATKDQNTYYDMLASALLSKRGPGNAKILETIAPGAYQALVKNSPALRDPRKGGRRDIESVRVRTMTPAILHDFAVAWDKWAFKPSMTDVMFRNDIGTVDIKRKGGPAAEDVLRF